MSRALATVATIAGSVALISTGIGAAVGAKGLAVAGKTISAGAFAKTAAIASVPSNPTQAGFKVIAK